MKGKLCEGQVGRMRRVGLHFESGRVDQRKRRGERGTTAKIQLCVGPKEPSRGTEIQTGRRFEKTKDAGSQSERSISLWFGTFAR